MYVKALFIIFALSFASWKLQPLSTDQQSGISVYSALPPISDAADDSEEARANLIRASLFEDQLPSAKDTLRILIHESRDTTKHSKTGAKANYFVTTVAHGGGIRLLEEHVFASLPLPRDIEILAERNNRFDLEKIELKEQISRRLLQYLTLGPPKRPFDCGSFVSYLTEIPIRKKDDPIYFEPVGESSKPEAHEIVAISKSFEPNKKDLVHYALSLGNGLYISKFGTRGGLRVTDLEEMKSFYDGQAAFRYTGS